jgi:ABC-type oligopeptide transport system substrate-binding subunit
MVEKSTLLFVALGVGGLAFFAYKSGLIESITSGGTVSYNNGAKVEWSDPNHEKGSVTINVPKGQDRCDFARARLPPNLWHTVNC